MQNQRNCYSDVYGSEFVSPDDLPAGKKIQVRIVANNVQDVEGFANGKKLDAHTRVVFTCTDMNGKPCKAKIVVNKTSAKRLLKAWGENFAAWMNKTIVVESGKVNGKPAVLLTPVADKNAPAQADDDLEQDEAEALEEKRIAAAQGQK